MLRNKTIAGHFWFIVVLATLLMGMALSGCASIQAPVKAAETVEQKAFALYGTFTVFEEVGADIVENPATPREVVLAIAKADAAVKGPIDSMLDIALEANQIRLQVEAGSTTEDKLIIATANLDDWVSRVQPLVKTFVDAVASGR